MRMCKSAGIVGACLAAVLSGVSMTADTASASSSKPVLTIAMDSPPTALDPSHGSGGSNAIFQAPAYQGLLHLEGNGAVVEPNLASSWKWIGSNNSELEVVLHHGLRFSDGTALDAAAVKASVEHFAAGVSPFAYVGKEIASVATPNNETVIFTLAAPDPTFAYDLSESVGLGFIISPKAISDNANLGTSTDGAGPYELSQSGTIEGTTYTYVPNPYYFDQSAIKYSQVVIKVIADPNTALAALQSGQVQMTYGEPANAKQAASAGFKTAAFPNSTDELTLEDDAGTLNPALANVDVRRAINYALDRPAIARAVTLGTGQPTDQMASPGTIGYKASLEKVYPYDVAKAKKLLAEGGYPHGFTMTITAPEFMAPVYQVSQIITEELGKIGINVQSTFGTTFSSYIAAQNSGKYDATVFSLPFTLGIPSTTSVVFAADGVGNPRHESYPDGVLAAMQKANALGGAAGKSAWEAINTTIVHQALQAPIETESTIYFYEKGLDGVSQQAVENPVFFTPAK
jgi:peptide/nickel transport system substrate-binding protein